ncbi:MAG: endonuclease VIII [Pseudomonadota bacterium]
MPEGPEIRLAADRLAAAVVDQPIEQLWFANPDAAAHAPELAESKVRAVKTKGKALLTEFDCGLTVYSHNQLYGRWYVVKRDRWPKTGRSLRWEISTPTHSALLYSASEIRVLDEEQLRQHPFLVKAGLDILSDKPSEKQLLAHITQKRFRNRGLGGLLLDQGFVAGLGNYLRSEILFCSGLRPEQRIADLADSQVETLAAQTIALCKRSYRTRGVTNDPQIVKGLKASGLRRREYRHFVFARAAEPCHLCGDTIEKTNVGSRRLYFCPTCQPG